MIYIMTHKKFDDPQLEGYVPLQVGAQGKDSFGYLQDNSGDNISFKNPNYCELTGLYWVWRNTKDKYKGLVHYRRYFGKSNLSNKIRDVYTYNQMIDLLKEADIILPYIEHFKQNAKDEILINCCTPKIFADLKNVINIKYPQYISDFDRYFTDNKSSLFNMMFCKSETFDSYCEWLFDILFELEKSVDMSVLNDYQKRLYGFLAERLLNVWVIHNGLRVKNVSVINTELSIGQRLTFIRRRITNQIFYSFSSVKNDNR